jgi:uncharacterized OB-fold protein
MPRKLPQLNPDSTAFWQGGREGRLYIHHCGGCQQFFHPPAPVCSRCNSLEVAPKAVSGRGRVASFTINHQAWAPDLAVPFVVAIVELEEQAGLRFVSNVVGEGALQTTIDMPVKVCFEHIEDVWLPLFERDLT